MKSTDLSKYDNSWYYPGKGVVVRTLWFVINVLFFINPLQPFSGLKVFLLRLFGTAVGRGVVIKPGVNIKYPWHLTIGENTWLGENVWIDSLCAVTIGKNCCLSQGAVIITGNHDYKSTTFDLKVSPVVLEEGVWLGAGSMITPGVTCYSHSVLSAGSVASSDLEPYFIYRGNPAAKTRPRKL
ncbi:MAG TPA: WcaF family extracellular polysaccharide biosynthesis acetyltransferase [Marinilabiliaceae bacterium]|nr:WcaF family extracellular polysaccharide biosynthesis acetyltransferase [Marinilabiliaceae bacterium]